MPRKLLNVYKRQHPVPADNLLALPVTLSQIELSQFHHLGTRQIHTSAAIRMSLWIMLPERPSHIKWPEYVLIQILSHPLANGPFYHMSSQNTVGRGIAECTAWLHRNRLCHHISVSYTHLIGESKIPLGLLIFSSILNILMDLWMVAGLGLGVFGAAIATLIAQGISAVFSFLIFLSRMRQYKSSFSRFDRQGLYSMLRIAVPSVLQQSTVSIGMMIVQAVVNPFGTQALAGYAATMRVENVFSLIFVSIGNAVSPYVSQNLGAKKIDRIKKGYHVALMLDLCFAVIAFVTIEALHTQISSLFLGKDGTALAYQVSGDYMRWLGYFFIFMGIKMATDGVLRGLGIMRPFLVANMVNLAIRLSVALICAPRFGIAFVWLAVPAGWLANFLISYGALRRSWPTDKMASTR